MAVLQPGSAVPRRRSAAAPRPGPAAPRPALRPWPPPAACCSAPRAALLPGSCPLTQRRRRSPDERGPGRGTAGSESESGRRSRGTMAVPLLVRLCPAPDDGEKAMLKLHSYFQSPKRSGGGECEVRADPEPGTYRVYFKLERDKKRVESRADHSLVLGGRTVEVVILQPGEGARSEGPAMAQAAPGQPQHLSPPGSAGLQAAQGHRDAAAEVLTKKIFLTVSAVLNTSMFTEQQRERIAIICPNLKREGNPDVDGSEKLTGDYTDIEKAYCYFKDVLAGNDQHYDFLHSESKKGVEDENDLNTKEMNTLIVPSALYEYFCHTCKEQIKEMYERFGVGIKSKDCNNGNTLISFASDTSPTSIRRANDFFTSAFQKVVKDVTQEEIPVANSYQLNEAMMKLNAKFSNLLTKQKDNQLLLRGPTNEILAAKKFLAEEKENNQDEKNTKISEPNAYSSGIEVDASLFKLLEPVLRKEIEDIEESFDVVIEKIGSSGSQQMLLVFKPRNKTSDLLPHSIESFINGFQNALAMLREKLISWKLSEHQKRKLNMLLDEKHLESLHVKLKTTEDKLILCGLPNHLPAAEKLIRNLLNAENSAETKKRTPLSSDRYNQEASGVSEEKYSGRQKSSYSSTKQAKAKAEDTDDTCPICMDKINNKEILTKCKHAFCKSCISMALEYKKTCPVCNTVYGLVQGDQPEGRMHFRRISSTLPGYPGCGTIEIEYVMQSGIQTENHPNPGKPYYGITRTAYLPDNKEGQEVLQLLRRAFNQKLIFTVGNSRTTGAEDVITWNDIHHKTSMYGGPMKFGYPDPDYLKRVRSELKARGIE
ncbi:E3 ubiquitin-protein ligase DTX3L [Numida meleagris]|uniref:E3 ubiquitin-protein ligase DTX3L n=1 Tax=Numida meleagris TaxID=8996 RepID=UPI000B3DCD49|nr:E3 ubiquitin-protein ligase DTX3L [Numida meleagris]